MGEAAVWVPTATKKTITTGGNSSSHSRVSYFTSKTQDTVRHLLTDDGVGTFGPDGTIDYASKTLNVRFVSLDSTTKGYKSDHEDAAEFETSVTDGPSSGTSSGNKGGAYEDVAVGEQVLAASTVRVAYAETFASPLSASVSWAPPTVSIDLCPYTSDYVIPNSVRFTWMGHVFEDFDGVIVRDRTPSDPGFIAGSLDYSTGVALMTDWVVAGAPTDFTLNSLWTVRQNWTTASIFMRTQAAPIKPSGFVMNLSDATGASITATAGIDGLINGTHLRGKIDYLTGVVELQFGDFVLDSGLTPAQKAEWWYSVDDVGAVQAGKIWRPWPVDPTTLRYNSVAFFYLPIDADLLGLDPVRLPPDGRVPMVRVGAFVVVGHSHTTGPVTVSNGQTIDMGRTRLSRVRVTGADGAVINTGYAVNLDAGTLVLTDVTGYSQPVSIDDRIEDLVRVSDVQINGRLTFTRQLSHDFPMGSIVSSALIAGDLKARVSFLFDQFTWDGTTWVDAPVGDVAVGSYNDALAPIVVTNEGALTERWALRFTSSTAFQIIGEHVGVIGTGSKDVDCAPINPITMTPYFTLLATGWGAGWATGNILRLNTVGAMAAFAAIRTVQQGIAAGTDYQFELLGRGDVDRPPSAP